MRLPKFLTPIGDRHQYGPNIAQRTGLEMDQPGVNKFEKVTWYKEPHLRNLYFLSIFLLVSSATTGYDGMMVNTSQQIDNWTAYFPEVADDNKLGILINMYNIGCIVSFVIAPYAADNLGRKPTIIISCLIMIVSAFISAFCNGFGMYIAGRFILGFGNALTQLASPMLLAEICHPQHRGPLTAVYNCLWFLGSLIVSVVGWGTASIQNEWSWRSLTLIQSVPAFIQIAGIWWVPESPRYLINQDKADEALKMLAKHHAGGDETNATVQFQFREIKQTIEAEKAANQTTSYLDFFKTKGNRWRLSIIISLAVISQYSGNALFSNYITIIYDGAGITQQNQKLALSAGKTFLDLSVAIGASLMVDKVGRRPLFLTAITGMVVSFIFWTIVGAIYENSAIEIPVSAEYADGIKYTNKGSGYAQIAFIWLFGVFYDLAFSGLLVSYTLEILPFHLRAKGMTIMYITVQAVLAVGNQTNKIAWNNLPNHWNFMLFYTLWDLVELVFVWYLYVETKGPTLEEIAVIFDGEDAVVEHIDISQIEKEIQLVHGE